MKIDAPEHASAALVFACSGIVPIVTHICLGGVIWLAGRFFVKPGGVSPTCPRPH